MAYCAGAALGLVGNFFNRLKLFSKVLIVMALTFPQILKAQKITTPIGLNNEQLPVLPKEFYVAGVTDERDDRNAIAWLLPPGKTAGKYSVDLKGGTLAAIKQFINFTWPPNKVLRPVIMHIKKFRLDESLLPGGNVEGRVSVTLSFYLQKDEGSIQLIDYTGSAGYSRPAEQQADAEPILRHALEHGLIYFNTWINREADTNIKLAKSVRLIFTDYTEQPEGDTVYYSGKRPLRWDDFRAKPEGGKYEAEVFPSIGYNEEVEVVKGIVNVHLSVKAYVPKSACWVKDGSRNAYSLNHEQRHFDIVKIIAEHFKKNLKAEKFTVDNYDGPVGAVYLESFHEMNVMQEQYDNETSHGTNPYAQQQWNEKIDKELGGKK
ncbi:MAG: hypothetical protein JWR38_3845 [Mucilaginibacter sp.]|nr:hypothetical protein [Mucilaginibacter sp.]